jgi:hypothetical protein
MDRVDIRTDDLAAPFYGWHLPSTRLPKQCEFDGHLALAGQHIYVRKVISHGYGNG